jgi:flagellar protein FliO/FliZ
MLDIDTVSAGRSASKSQSLAASDATGPGANETSGDDGTGLLSALVKMISALVVVVVCIYGGMWLLGRISGRGKYGGGSNRNLEVIETTYVGPKKTVSLVRVGERAVLVGVTDSQVNVLTELDEDETAKVVSRPAEQAARKSFKPLLTAAFGRLKEISPQHKEAAA